MKKYKYLFPAFIFSLCLGFMSCSNNDDDKIDETWKTLNEKRFQDIGKDPSYNALSSQTQNGFIYWKPSSVITDSDKSPQVKITVGGEPEFTDTIVVRYEGWYFDKDDKKIIFDSTENPSLSSRIDYAAGKLPSIYPNKKKVQGAVNSFIDGWTTVLQYMKVGEEREIVIPQELAYGKQPLTHQSSATSPTYVLAPGYTTLWFRLKLLKVIPLSGSLEEKERK